MRHGEWAAHGGKPEQIWPLLALWAKEISAKIPWGSRWSVGGNGPPKVSGPASLSKHGCHLHAVRLAVPWSSHVSKVRGWDLQNSRVSCRNSVRSGT